MLRTADIEHAHAQMDPVELTGSTWHAGSRSLFETSEQPQRLVSADGIQQIAAPVGSWCDSHRMVETSLDAVTASSGVVAVLISLYVLRVQLGEQRESREAREREDAMRVSCWADWSSEGVHLLSGAVLREPVIHVSNRTSEPVFGAFFDYRDQLDGHPVRVDVGTLPPEVTRTVAVRIPSAALSEQWEPAQLLPTLYFRDTSNRWWHRNTIGRLERDRGPASDDFFASGGTFAPVTDW